MKQKIKETLSNKERHIDYMKYIYANVLFARHPTSEECLTTLKASVFLDMYEEFLKSKKILEPDCPCRALSDIHNRDCYDW